MESPQSKLNPFADWLWAQIKERPGETQNEIADTIGITRSSLSNYLNGKALPARRNLRRIAAAFGVEPAMLLGLVAESEPQVNGETPSPPDIEDEDDVTIETLNRDRHISPLVKDHLREIIRREHRRHRESRGK